MIVKIDFIMIVKEFFIQTLHYKGVYDMGHIKIESAESFSSVAPYIVMYDNQLQQSHSGFELVKVGDEDKSTVERICIKKESGRGRYPVPSEFINGTFDISKNVTDDEMKSCGAFLNNFWL